MQRLTIISVSPMSIPAWIKRQLSHTGQAIMISPDDADAHYNLGHAYERSGMDTEAIESYRQVIRINPDYADAHYNLGHAYANVPAWIQRRLSRTAQCDKGLP